MVNSSPFPMTAVAPLGKNPIPHCLPHSPYPENSILPWMEFFNPLTPQYLVNYLVAV